jgi:hypothetical protein
MTERPESLEAALEDRDLTLALTPGQIALAVLAIWLLLRFIRSLRS